MVYVIPIICLVVPLIAAAVAMRKGLNWAPVAMALILAAIMAWAIWKGRQVSGWDGIGYGIVAMLMAAPGILGVAVGSAVGWWQRRKASRGAPD